MSARVGSKYRNVECAAGDGTIFGSQKERNRYEELLLLERLGEIEKLERQVKWVLIPKQGSERAVKYYSDFQYFDKRGKFHVEDTKGMRTKEYVIKRKLLKWIHGVTIEEL
jgi:hypothetical protein